MPSKQYWKRRYLKDKVLSVNDAEKYISRHAAKLYMQAEKEIQDEIERFYKKYAKENKITLLEAKRRLSHAEFGSINWEEYCRQAQGLGQALYKKEHLPSEAVMLMEEAYKEHEENIKRLAVKGNITRLELLQADINSEILKLHNASQVNLFEYLSREYEDGYYRGIYNIQHGIGVGCSFAAVNTRAVEKALLGQAGRSSFSKTIYQHQKNLKKELTECLAVGMTKGEDLGKLARRVQKRINVSYSNARRLVRTETAYAYEQAVLDSYAECGVLGYEYLATLDKRTSRICQELDGKHFKTEDAMPGTNYPPMHPNCRSTTVPVFENDAVSQRAARDENGSYYTVPSNMTYKEWKQSHVPKEQVSPHGEYGRYSENEIKQFAQEARRLADKHFSARKSKWSGNIVFKDLVDASARKEWNCDISTGYDTAQHILLHEQLHAKSVSYYDKKIFYEYWAFEEGPTELLAKEICMKENISIVPSSYDDMVDALRTINKKAHIYDTDYEFAVKLYEVELVRRREWLENVIDKNMQSSTIEDRMAVSNLISTYLGG